MPIPKIFHIGLMKTGTTFLQNVLSDDDRIDFFCQSRIINTNNYYSKKYKLNSKKLYSIESDENIIRFTGNMCGLETSLNRIIKDNPDAKIVLTIREQKQLLISAYKHLINRTNSSLSFQEFIHSHQGMLYLDSLNYKNLIERILNFIPINNIIIIPFELVHSDNYISTFYKKVFNLSTPNFNKKNIDTNKNMNDCFILKKRKLNSKLHFIKNRGLSNIENNILNLRLKIYNKIHKKKNTKLINWSINNKKMEINLEKQWRNSNAFIENLFNIQLQQLGYKIWINQNWY